MTREPQGFLWTCPVCGRRVPKRVDACFCGVSRSQAESYETGRARHASKPRVGLVDVTLLVAASAAAVLAAYRFLRPAEPDRPWPPSLARPAEPAAPDRSRVLGARPPVAPPPEAGLAESAPVPALAPRAEPAPEPAPGASAMPPPLPPAEAPDPSEVRRAEALRALEARLRNVAAGVEALVERQRDYERLCQGVRLGDRVGNCDAVQASLPGMADELARELEEVEDAARRGWLAPGSVRQLRERLALDSSRIDALLRAARATGR